MELLLVVEPFLSPSSWDRLMPLLIAVIAATPPTLMGLAAYKRAGQGIKSVEELTVHVNSRFDEILKAEGEAGELRGRASAHTEQVELAESKETVQEAVDEAVQESEGSHLE